MKRFIGGFLLALFSVACFGTTFNPIQLLNPAGSLAGQAIVSTGPTGVPAWSSAIGGLPQYSVLQYGALCDGSTNDSTAIQSAINAAQSAGGGSIILPPGKTCAISTTLAVSASNVGFHCPAGGLNLYALNPTTQPTTGCWLKWTGSTGGTMMSFISPSGSTSNFPIQGVFLEGVDFNGNAGLAANAVEIQSVWGSRFTDDGFWNFKNGVIFDINVIKVSSTNFAGGAQGDDQGDYFSNLSFASYLTSSSVPMRLAASVANGVAYESNVSYSTFNNLSIGVNGGTEGMLLQGADNNVFTLVNINSYSGTAASVDFNTTDSFGNLMPANGNTFIDFGGNNAPIARGQTSSPTCVSAYTFPYTANTCTVGNVIYSMDSSNSVPAPVVEPGAQISWKYANGYSGKWMSGASAMGDTEADAISASGKVTTETLRVANSSGNNLVLSDAAGANAWGINIDGSSNLRLTDLVGGSSTVYIPSGSGSTSAGTGALVVGGGLGVGGAINAGGVVSGASGAYLPVSTAASTYATIAQATTSLAATGGTINGVTVGTSSPSTGAFTTLSASGNDALMYSNTSGQSVPNNTATTVTGWTKTYDRLNSSFNASTGVFTAPATGYYNVSAQLFYAANTGAAGTNGDVYIVANGAIVAAGIYVRPVATSLAECATASAVVSLTAGQTIVIQANQNSGAAVALQTAGSTSFLSINRLP